MGWQFRLPTIAVLNGEPLLRRFWTRRRIRSADELTFLSRPLGGLRGTSAGKVGGLIALVALAAIAGPAGPLGAALAGQFGTVVGGVLGAGFVLGGSLLINALVAPRPGGQSQESAASQVDQLYSLAAQGNTARPLQPIPVTYGRLQTFPDFAATPWAEYAGNDQYLNVLLSLGCGKSSVESLYIDDTLLWTSAGGVQGGFQGVSVEYYDPGEEVTLFPINVVSSGSVSGQEITQTAVGPFAASAPGTQTQSIAVDLVFPSGCFTVDGNGNLRVSSVLVTVEAQPIDNAGAPTGSWFTLTTQTFSYATRNPQRTTLKTDVAPGRYQVRVSRSDAPLSGSTGVNNMSWAGLRGFVQGPSSFEGVGTLAIRILATAQITSNSARKFGVLRTRILPVWNGTTFVEQATRNPFWAFYDAATNTDYGAGRPAGKIDFQAVVDLAAIADSRGDTFDYEFTSAQITPQAFDTILKPARSRHRWIGDVLSCVRDQFSSLPQMLLTDREIVRGSLSIDWAFNTDDQSDAVIVQYIDENTWTVADVQYPPDSISFTAENPATIKIDGIVNRDQAYREAAFYYLQAYYRRTTVTLDTEHDGRLLSFGSAVRVQTELPESWGATGTVVSVSGHTLTLSPAPAWTDPGQFYIAIRTKRGGQWGPVKCTRGTNDSLAVLDPTDQAAVEASQSMTLAEALARADGADDPSFDFGAGTRRARDCVVLSGRPNGDKVTVSLFVDDAAVHTDDLPDVPSPPAVPVINAYRDTGVPLIQNLSANFRQGVAEPILDASWWPAIGAHYYEAQVSYDSGASWRPIYQNSGSSLSVVVDRANLTLRVAGVGERHGPWSSVDVDAPIIKIAPGTVDPASLEDSVTEAFKRLNADIASIKDAIAAAARQDAANWTEKLETRRLLSVREGVLSASIEEVDTVAVSTQAALAEIETTVSAASGDGLAATVTQTFSAVATINGNLASAWVVQLNNNGNVASVGLYGTGTTSVFAIEADVFKVASTSSGHSTPVDVFAIDTVSGTAKVVFRGDMFADGVITARAVQAGTITGTLVAATTLDTLNIKNAAITVFGTATLGSDFGGSTGSSWVNVLSVSLSVTATSGSTVNVDCIARVWVQSQSAFTSADTEWRLTVNGTPVDDLLVTGPPTPSSVVRAHDILFGVGQVTGTGSAQTITVNLDIKVAGAAANWLIPTTMRAVAYKK